VAAINRTIEPANVPMLQGSKVIGVGESFLSDFLLYASLKFLVNQ
jgi:hypothetical protein